MAIDKQRTVRVEDALHLDFDTMNNLVGIEILNAAERYSKADILNLSTEKLVVD